MKKLFIVCLLVFGLSAAQAQIASAFSVFTTVTWQPLVATSTVYNPYGYPLYCMVGVQGVRADGLSVWNNVPVMLYPGQYGYSAVYTNGWVPFVGAFGSANCWF